MEKPQWQHGLSVREQASRSIRGSRPYLVPSVLADLWADEAAYGLSRRRPADSARSGLTRGQLALVSLLSVCAGLLLVWAPELTGQIGWVLAGGAFVAILTVRLLALSHARVVAPQRDLPENALPKASLLVPVYREERVLPALVAALRAIRYPADRLEIKLAIEADDAGTLAAAQSLDLDPRFEIITVPPGSPRTKPRALNYALRFCTHASSRLNMRRTSPSCCPSMPDAAGHCRSAGPVTISGQPPCGRSADGMPTTSPKTQI